VPGVDLFSYGGFGAQIDYGIRGTTSSQTLVLQDGIPIASGSNGVVDLGSLSTVGVGRIEVVESGASTLYGSNATGGVINIITSLRPQPYFSGSPTAAVRRPRRHGRAGRERQACWSRSSDTSPTNVYTYPAFAYSGGNATTAGTRVNADAEQSVGAPLVP
jgi:outer membrane cobalamin receptor